MTHDEPETIGGVPVTEEMIDTWADEAEAGYAPEQGFKAAAGSGS